MYLSKLLLQGVGDPYQWHRALWGLFLGEPDAGRPFLFRLERMVRGGAEVLMQSTREPGAAADRVTVVATKPFRPRFAEGQSLRFRLTANPVRTIRDEAERPDSRGQIKSCRVPLVQEDQQLEWLRRKLTGAAALEKAIVNGRKPLHFRKGARGGKIVQVTFEGALQVVDPDRFSMLLAHGVGPAKAFGCGLLTVART